MGLLSAILGGDHDDQGDRSARVECPHERLVARWRGPEVMGDDSRAMGFICQDCGQEFLTYQVQDRKVIAR
jgi:hypothetical protein